MTDRRSRLPALVAAAVVCGIDLVLEGRRPPRPVRGVLDELAHATTAGLLLGALARRQPPAWTLAALAGAVLLDADHVPEVFGWDGFAAPGERPYPHTLLTVLALAVAGRWLGGARGDTVSGVAAGVATHLVRDMATGGCLAYWPLSSRSIQIPYWGYAAALLLLPWASRRMERRP
jgi:inner membrane protein